MNQHGERPKVAPGAGSMTFDMRAISAIFAGGFAGTVLRVALAESWVHGDGGWPWATLVVNIFGAFLLGYVATRLQERLPPSTWPRPLLGTGLCGALTTFSAFQLELFLMFEAGKSGMAVAYAAVTVAGGFIAILLATGMVRRAGLTR
jgi:fluoride exporter